MNRITRIAAIALSFAAAGSAFAESPLAGVNDTVPVSVLSRADVLAQARGITVTEADLNQADAPASPRSRAEVRAEVAQALASRELPLVAVDSNAFAVQPAAQQPNGSLQLASAGR